MESGPQRLRTPSREFSDEIGKVSLTLSIDIDSRTAMTCESINSQLPLPDWPPSEKTNRNLQTVIQYQQNAPSGSGGN